MPITVTCTCGKQYQVANEHAGKAFTCKACNTKGTVPADEAPSRNQKATPLKLTGPPPAFPPLPQVQHAGVAKNATPPATDDTRQCPSCAETIKTAAKKCRHCGERVDTTPRLHLTRGALAQVQGRPNYGADYDWPAPTLRLFARLIDLIVGLLLAAVGIAVGVTVGIVLGVDPNTPMAIGAAIGVVADLGLQLKYMSAGQSIGKSFLNLVVMDAGTTAPCGLGKTFGRDLIHYGAGLIPLLETVAVLADALLVIHPSRRRLVDWAENTDVLLRKTASRIE